MLQFMMHSGQKSMYDIYKSSPDNSILVWLLARQSGKSFNIGLIATMECIEKPNVIVKILTDTKLHAKTIFEPIFREIFENFPEDMRPEYIASSFVYIFKNGSQIQLAGSDGNSAERLRGQKSDLILVDEAGFCSNLYYNVMSVLVPTTTHTGGRVILASTPSPDPDHEFTQFIEMAEQNKLLTKKTVYDNPMLTKEQIDNIISKFKGGVNNSQFRREYLCEQIKDETLSVLPEVDDELLSEIVKEHPAPPFFHRYVAMDIGFKDLTVILFGYYDFREDKIIIQDEIVKNGKEIHLPVFTKEIQDKENELWMNPLTNELIKPESRVSDIGPFVIQEISTWAKKSNPQHSIEFGMASKDNKLAHINKLRVLLANKKVIIHPKCETLIRHLKHCKWKDKSAKDDYAKSPDDGHYDAVDALLYFSRAINYNKNPYPATYGYDTRNLHIENRGKFESQTPEQVYRTIFGVSGKKRKN
jgi:phage terminase large subunit